jgi:hypothetical protein
VHIVLDLWLGVDNPKSRKLSLPKFEISNAGVIIDFLKEILDPYHNLDLLAVNEAVKRAGQLFGRKIGQR